MAHCQQEIRKHALMTFDDLIPLSFFYKRSQFLIMKGAGIARSYLSLQFQIGEYLGNLFENSQCVFDGSAEMTQLMEGML